MRWDREFVLGGHQDEAPCQWTVGSPAALRDGTGQRVGGQVLGRSDSHLRPCRPCRTPAPASLAPYACARAYARTRAACALCPTPVPTTSLLRTKSVTFALTHGDAKYKVTCRYLPSAGRYRQV